MSIVNVDFLDAAVVFNWRKVRLYSCDRGTWQADALASLHSSEQYNVWLDRDKSYYRVYAEDHDADEIAAILGIENKFRTVWEARQCALDFCEYFLDLWLENNEA